MTKRLAITCQPMPDESLDGFLRRSLLKNYVKNLTWFEEIGLPHDRSSKSFLAYSSEISTISEILGVSAAELFGATPLPSAKSKHIVLGNGRFTPSDFRKGSVAVCPLCIAESHFHHVANLVEHVQCCPIHECSLIEACRKCGHPLVHGVDLAWCSCCRAPISETWTEPASGLSVALAKMVASIIRGGINSTPLKWLRAESEAELFMLADKIGFYEVDDDDVAHDRAIKVEREAIGISVLSNGRQGIVGLMKRLGKRAGPNFSHRRHRNLALFGQDVLHDRRWSQATDTVSGVYNRFVTQKQIEDVPRIYEWPRE